MGADANNSIATAIGQAMGSAASTAVSPVTDVVTAAIRLGMGLIDRVWPDPAQKAQAQLALLQLAQSGDLSKLQMQADVNKSESMSRFFFVAGWRPFIGWICGTGLAYEFVFRPIANGIADVLKHPQIFQPLDTSALLTLLFGMLGLGAMRTAEKINSAPGAASLQ